MCLPNNLNNANNTKKQASMAAVKLKATTPWGRIKQVSIIQIHNHNQSCM